MSIFWSFPKTTKSGSLGPSDKKTTKSPKVYDTKIDVVKRLNPLWSINKQQRDHNNTNYSPNPGVYSSIGKVSRTAPAYSLQSKHNHDTKENVPGRGTYEPQAMNLKNNPKFTFSRKIYANFSCNKYTPAPGAYNPKIDSVRPSSAKNSFSKAKRGGYSFTGFNQGPAYYEIKDTENTIGGVISKAKKGVEDNYSKTPGPGTYDVYSTTLNLKQNVAPYFKSNNRSIQYENEIPGIGQYNANPLVVKKKTSLM